MTLPAADPPLRPWRLRCGGFDLHDDAALISEQIALALANDAYERSEISVLGALLQPGDRLLEIGGGIGVVALHAARILGPQNVTSYEANPKAARAASRNFALNGMDINLVQAAVMASGDQTGRYRECDNFLAGSLHENVEASRGEFEVPAVSLSRALAKSGANIVLMDIEGGEAALTASGGLGDVRAVVLEIHPQILGENGALAVADNLIEAGFEPRADLMHGDVHGFQRGASGGETARRAAQASIRASAARHLGDDRAAAAALQEALDLISGNPDLWAHLSQRRYGAGDFEGALEAGRRMAQLNPKDAMSHYLMAVSALKLDRNRDALDMARQAVRLSPASPRYYALICQAAHRAGQGDEALKQAQTLVEMAPWSAHHLNLLEREYRHAGLPHLAQRMADWKRALESAGDRALGCGGRDEGGA